MEWVAGLAARCRIEKLYDTGRTLNTGSQNTVEDEMDPDGKNLKITELYHTGQPLRLQS